MWKSPAHCGEVLSHPVEGEDRAESESTQVMLDLEPSARLCASLAACVLEKETVSVRHAWLLPFSRHGSLRVPAAKIYNLNDQLGGLREELSSLLWATPDQKDRRKFGLTV